ncbi:autotransporter outer membrane beta-barrel domain-containing protein [Roseomonas frigidaquae]|uniref:Autotransporter outer membrane beta-barrel domain-containing protein n=1 Tax=Falsiroseomonas frigidaquae TaxID=487318 RepID=A0ABX1ETD5_9PROT|nr:autotransporter outer membrane beta-barrel domain-containing protein [Falsiroseomonas frigidaquae]NKE43891.1 autotransporter outer membrane beta-barrel domain-containing protein [Falsiroseomonas frigidaquae]
MLHIIPAPSAAPHRGTTEKAHRRGAARRADRERVADAIRLQRPGPTAQPLPGRATWLRHLRTTTALTTASGLVAFALLGVATAQTVLPPNQSLPYVPHLSGTAGTPGNEGNPPTSGGPGGAGTAVDITVPAGVTWQSNSAGPLIGLDTSGGNGGRGGTSDCDTCAYQNGGDGGAGLGAGSATLQIGGSPAQPGSITNQGAGPAIAIVANGGSGGTGGNPANRGTGGRAGTSGSAGSITFGMVAGASVAATAPGTPAIILQSSGGNGGNGGDGTVTHIDHAYGPNGASGQSGGAIQTPATPIGGTITSAGSGIVAISRGGNGGWGAEAGSEIGSVTAGTGGAGGLGGLIILNLEGASVTAQGASGPGTGGQITVDAGTNGSTTANASVMTAAMSAASIGGLGGYSDVANGNIVSHGGNGGAGGNGGSVQINVDGGRIQTTGYGAMGLVAVSAGAAGGTGGEAGAVWSRSGGAGGTGGNGLDSTITVTDGTILTTTGRHADGVLALSVGGGGGIGGDVEGGGLGMSLAFGGHGGNGGDGGTAMVFNGLFSEGLFPGGVVSTTGSRARGLSALSVGGGGGRGGDANTADLGVGAFAIGGNGGTGGAGGLAEVTNFGVVQTTGLHAVGIDAQSIGGGGGNGGAAHAYNISASGVINLSAAAAVGGTGGGCTPNGACPTGGTATVLNYGQVLTMGGDAHGIRAQSIGGGGGHGGASVAENLMVNLSPEETPTIQLTASIGGNGGRGGDGGPVAVLNAGMVIAQGVGAHGIIAQSIGGGGGTGGDSTATTSSITPSSLSITTAIGGSGAGGGDGRSVNVNNSGLIWTLNRLAPGISAQSIGGGGGTGGYGNASADNYTDREGTGLAVNVSLGGTGGVGGEGGNVTVTNYVTAANTPDPTGAGGYGAGAIATMGDGSDGIYAHSIGGGGGNGGNASANGGSGTVILNISLGANGGSGGSGHTVAVDNGTGTIQTLGGHSAGIFAQSVGGGGGRGGNGGQSGDDDPNFTVNTLMQQGLGLNGEVTQVVDGVYQWTGQVAGYFDQPGTLSAVVNAYIDSNMAAAKPETPESSESSLTVNLGAGLSGSGGGAGNGGQVTVLNAGSITTAGPLSPAIFAQSIGGGGGLGGASNPAMDQAQISSSKVTLSMSLGGANGLSGSGGRVGVTVSGVIVTGGDASPGILAQSIGGGGGHGGVTMMGASNTTDGSGLLGTVTLGMDRTGNGRAAWNAPAGGPVAVTTSNVTTTGDESPGVLAQSVGGGGGIAAAMSGVYNPRTGGWTSALNSLPADSPQWVDFRFMANAPAGSTGGPVNVTLQPNGISWGNISTGGQNSYGILAQSVGNGGGIAITDYTPYAMANFIAPELAVAGSNAGAVTVTTVGPSVITTTGDGAVGILAQSVAGGGIVGGMDGVAMTYRTVNYQAQSYGGTVTVNNSADIHVSGAYAHGIFAQSTALGGAFGPAVGTPGTLVTAASAGSCGSDCASVGQVTVNHDGGTIFVHGANAYGIAMISQGNPSGTNNTTLNVGPGGWIATDVNAAGAVFIGGADANAVNNYGIINAQAAGLAFATWADSANTRATAHIVNYGGIMGSAVLGDASVFTNAGGGQWQMGPVVDLGAAGRVNNAGTLEVGHGRSMAGTTLTGSLTQSAGGRLVVDTDHAARRGDLLTVHGAATIAGRVETRPASVANAPVTVLTATGGVTLDPATTATRTAAFNFQPLSDGTSLRIHPRADFVNVASGLGAAQAPIAGHLQQVWDSGGSLGDNGFTLLAGIDDGATYGRAMDTLSGQTLGAIAAWRFASSQTFVNNMQSCPTFVNESLVLREENCSWVRATGSTATQNALDGALGYRVNTETVQLGGQWEFAPDWFIGASAAYENTRFSGEQGTSRVTGNGWVGGLAVKYNPGNWLFTGAIDAGFGNYSSSRQVEVGDFVQTATASPDAWHVGGTLRASYQAAFDGFYLRPMAELRLINVANSGYTETGAAPFNLAVSSASSTTVAGTGALELGTRINLGETGTLHLFASAGLSLYGNDGWAADARFAAAPAGTSNFRATTPIPDMLGRFALGANLYTTGNLAIRVQYSADIGDGFAAHTGMARVAYRF